MERKLAVVIMAAGKGTRMKNPSMAKVMYTVDGKPMIEHVVDLALSLAAKRTVVIVGWQKDSVIAHLAKAGKDVICVEQNPQLGTGHAVMQAEPPLADFSGDVLVLSGDVPLLTVETVRTLMRYHREESAVATLLTAILEDPTGYGRILRADQGGTESGTRPVIGIVEHKDASEGQRKIREINSGIYVFDKAQLYDGLKHISPNNVQKEYYLTDVFHYFWRNHLPVRAVPVMEPFEIQGINTFEQLEEARTWYARRRRKG